MANPVQYKNIWGGSGTAVLLDSTTAPTQARRLRVGEWSLDLAVERSAVNIDGIAFAVGSFDKSVKATGKAKLKAYSSADILSLAPNAVRTAGKPAEYKLSLTIAASVATGKTNITDHGVDDAAGKPMDRVDADPDVGEYAVVESTGTYAFNEAEPAGKATIYCAAADLSGETVTISAGDMANDKHLALVLFAQDAKTAVVSGVKVCNAKVTKMALAVKTAEAAEWDVDFECEADSNGDVLAVPSDF